MTEGHTPHIKTMDETDGDDQYKHGPKETYKSFKCVDALGHLSLSLSDRLWCILLQFEEHHLPFSFLSC